MNFLTSPAKKRFKIEKFKDSAISNIKNELNNNINFKITPSNFFSLSKQLLCPKSQDTISALLNPVPAAKVSTINHNLMIKLNSAMTYAKRSVAFGAVNKIEGIIKTTGCNFFHATRYNYVGKYVKKNKGMVLNSLDKDINVSYNTQENLFNTNIQDGKWYYKAADEAQVGLMCRFPGLDPLNDSQFKCNRSRIDLLTSALKVLEKKQGNCGEQADLVAKYLWENSQGISRIEVISMRTFDHAFVVVNRMGKLPDPLTWGDNCWIVDAWYGEDGWIFKAEEFDANIITIKKFCSEQIKQLQKMNIPIEDNSINSPERIKKNVCEIIPSEHPYPTYSYHVPGATVFYPIEYYYEVASAYPTDCHNAKSHTPEKDISPIKQAFFEHQTKFKPCLEAINIANQNLSKRNI